MLFGEVQELQCPVGAFGRGRMSLPAHEVDAAVYAYEGTCSHIPNQPIVLNWQVARHVAATGLDSGGSSHVRRVHRLVDSMMGEGR